MIVPIIPILAWLGIIGGGATVIWYDSLSRSEKDKANRLAGEYAASLFGKALDQLSEAESRTVYDRVRSAMSN